MADIEVKATEHKTLNFSKGVIYCNELRNIDETEILNELKPQKVTEVRKIIKKTRSIFNRNWLNYNNIPNPYSPRFPQHWIRKDSRTRIHPTPIKVQKMLTIWTTYKSPEELCKN